MFLRTWRGLRLERFIQDVIKKVEEELVFSFIDHRRTLVKIEPRWISM